MKLTGVTLEQVGNNFVITVKEKGWIREKTTKYQAPKKPSVGDSYWSWLQLPLLEPVPDRRSFQLDAWCENLKCGL
jgi:hypothetical protein